MNALIPLKNQPYDTGYIYMVRFQYFKDNYKIGSSRGILNRIQQIQNQFGPVELIAYGFSHNKIRVEKTIHYHLGEYSNKDRKGYDFAGSLNSQEYFTIPSDKILNIIHLFDLLCTSVIIGSPCWKFGKDNHLLHAKGWGEA